MGKKDYRARVNKRHPLWVNFIGFEQFHSEHRHPNSVSRLQRMKSSVSSAELEIQACLALCSSSPGTPQGYSPPLAQKAAPPNVVLGSPLTAPPSQTVKDRDRPQEQSPGSHTATCQSPPTHLHLHPPPIRKRGLHTGHSAPHISLPVPPASRHCAYKQRAQKV